MPRTILDEHKERNMKIVEVIWGKKAALGLSTEDVAIKSGISSHTLYRRRNRPEEFTLGELIKLCRTLNVPIEELRGAIRY